jgi:Mg-chelatase subunit ChlD
LEISYFIKYTLFSDNFTMRHTCFVLFLLAALCLGGPVFAQELFIGTDDLRLEQGSDGGFHLFIRKKPGISSVLLTESTRDPRLQADNYAYRAPEWNAVNGDEIRLLDGVPIPRESGIWSLIDSSPETHSELGPAFHIYIPWIINYGYDYTRHGEIYISDGTYLNIRAFSLPYGDYRGSFRDNPFLVKAVQRLPEDPPKKDYLKATEEAFKEIAESGKGELIYSTGPEDLVEKIRAALEREKGKAVDIVLCLDTTNSMKNDIDAVRSMLIPMLQDIIGGFSSFRIGMVLYKDYYDEYLNRVIPFTGDFDVFQRNLNAIVVRGGGDIPEAVHEALYQGALKFSWEAESRLIILIGDAPPHLRQRGKISKTMVDEEMEKKNIKVHAIILPN